MEYKMRRSDRALTEEETRSLLERGEYGILSTVDQEGVPYGVPVSYAVEGDTIYFHGILGTGHKYENMKANHRVCFTVVGNTKVLPEKFSTEYESAIVFGTVREVEGEEKMTGLIALVKKYSPDFMEKGHKYAAGSMHEAGVYAITIQQITGKARKPKKVQ